MARDPHIEARLQRWAAAVTLGDGSGYPAMCVLHPEWQPPAPGVTPTLKSAPASDARATHRAIERLSMRLRNTIAVHYCQRLSLAEQALRLECAESTIHARIEQAHRELQVVLKADTAGLADLLSEK
jgi:DNA-directed RNA polymerase specialized sigma24 family protein